MKIGYTSDIHIDINEKKPVIQELIRVAREQKVEMLLIGGDISNFGGLSLSTMEYVQNVLEIPVHFVLGNHDYYECGDKFHQYRQEQNTFPVIGDGFGIIGDTGWYDYSWYCRGSGQLQRLKKGKTSGHFTWPDHRFITWPVEAGEDKSGAWFAEYSLNEMKRQNDILDSAGITRKIVMMHMVPHYDLLESNFDYLETNTFFGADCTSKWLKELKPEMVLFGHTHFIKDKIIDGTWYVCSPVGYEFEWIGNTYDRVKNRFMTFEV